MPRLPKKVTVRIKDFNRYKDSSKYKKTWRYLKIDSDMLDELHFQGLDLKESMVFMRLLLIAFRQRSEVLTVFLDTFKHLLDDFEPVLRTLERHNFIKLGQGNIIYNNIKEGRESLTNGEIKDGLKLITESMKT